MARQASVSIENNFTKGLITEATGLNFPENAATETYDCIFHRTGEVTRRLGIKLEESFESNTVDELTDSAITEFVWRAVSLNGETIFFVLQIGSRISFYQLDTDGNATLKSFIVDLNAGARVPGSPDPKTFNASFASGNGQLYIAHPSNDPIIVEYDPNTDNATSLGYALKVRDVTGLPNYAKGTTTLLDHDHRPTDAEFGWNAYYNLLNRGWGEPRTITWNRKFWGFTTPLAAWRHAAIEFVPNALALFAAGLVNPAAIAGLEPGRTDWPSDADQIELMKQPLYPNIDDTGNVVAPIPPPEAWSVLGINESQPGNSPAPRGKFIFDAFHMHRAGIGNDYNSHPVLLSPGELPPIITDAPPSPEYTQSRPSQIAFFAGRVWYAGVENNYGHINIPLPKYNTRIYFSQIVENNQHYAECYQRNDPSNSEAPSNDLLPNDGGIVVIPEVSKVIKLVPYGSSLLVFATNGVWKITGTADGAGFTAIDYSVSKLTDFGAISALPFVVADGNPIWWNSEGIFTIASNGVTPPAASSLSLTTIQDFYDDIPVASRRYAKAAFNKSSRIVQWIYRSTAPTNIQERYQYDRVLNLDLTTGAFYPWTIGDSCLYVGGLIVTEGIGSHLDDVDVTDDGVVVTDGGDTVTELGLIQEDIETRFKYVVFNECEDVVTEDIPPTLTYNRNFLGHITSPQVVSNFDAGIGAIIIGEDNKIYIPTGTDDTLGQTFEQRSTLQRFDGTGSIVNYPIESFTTDMANTVGITNSGFTFTSRTVIPVPFTQYFYFAAYGGVAATGISYLIYGLYKVNGSGAIHFMNAAHAYEAHFSIGFSIDNTNAVDYASFTGNRLDRNILIAFGPGHIVSIPSVNHFIANPTLIGNYTDINTGYLQSETITAWFGDTYNPESSNDVVFLPSSDGMLLGRYVDWATCQAHVNDHNPIGQSSVIDPLAASHPTGFFMTTPINTENWSVVSGNFKNTNGSAMIPFTDVLLDRNQTDPGFASEDYLNDWTTPVHQFDEANNIHYLIWTRRYRPIEANQTAIGTYRKVLIQTWNPATQIATSQADASGGPYDTVVDLGLAEPARFGSYPRLVQSFFGPDFTEVFMYSRYDASSPGTGWNNVLAKFGDFTPGQIFQGTASTAFGEFTNTSHIDWAGVTSGKDYTSYFTTGYKVRGEAIRKFQANYLQLYTKNEMPSSFDVFGKWDWSISGNTGRWNSKQRVVMDNTDYLYRTRRLKMRGNGKALQFKISSVDREPFNVIGFSVYETTNASV